MRVSVTKAWDAIVIGSGPNGLTAAATIARAGFSVLVLEAAEEIGGGAKTLALTLPGFLHDVCSAIHPLAVCSPALFSMPLAHHGLEWIHPDAPLAHPLDDGRAIVLERSAAATAAQLGGDRDRYYRLLDPAVKNWDLLTAARLRIPRDVSGLLRFGYACVRSAAAVLGSQFRGAEARALMAGLAGHSNLPLEESPSAGFGLFLGAAAHAGGWPFPRGGAGRIARALASCLQSMGATIQTGVRVDSLDDLPRCRTMLCDLSPRELVRIAGRRFPSSYRQELEDFRYGPAAFKVDWALDSPVPWAAPECLRAGTIHVGGTAEEIARSERAVWSGECPDRPFVIAAQHTLFDSSRAPAGKHTLWGYCHVPNGSPVDMTERIEQQIERFAPGFRNRILARSVRSPADLERHNANLVGGDFCGGANCWHQLLARPTILAHRTADDRVLLCSSATPPGAGVHGMCGDLAARVALRRLRRDS